MIQKIQELRAGGALAVALFLATGCGGGGDGAAGAPAAADTIAPTVSYVTPANNAANVGTNGRVTVTFSEPMSEASLPAAISLADADSGTPVALRSIVYDAANRIATVTPQSELAASRRFRAAVSTAAADSSGNTMTSSYAWTFGTAVAPDTTAPGVSSHAPAAGAVDVATNARIAMSFSEPMDVASVGAAFVLARGADVVSGQLSYIGQAAVFRPDAPLLPATTYVATLRRSAADLAGNTLVADHSWSFTTGSAADTTPPMVVAVTPPADARDVAREAVLSVRFNEPIYPFVYGTIDGVVVDVSIDYATHTASLIPTAPLRSNGGYLANVSAADLARNTMDAPFRWAFVTAP